MNKLENGNYELTEKEIKEIIKLVRSSIILCNLWDNGLDHWLISQDFDINEGTDEVNIDNLSEWL